MALEDLLKGIEDEELRTKVKDEIEWRDTVNKEQEEKLEKLEAQVKEQNEQIEKLQKDAEGSDDDATMDGHVEVPEEVQKQMDEMREKIEKAQEAAETERKARLKMEFQKKAEEYENVAKTDDVSELLLKAHDIDDEFAEKLEEVLKTANERIANGELFKQKGSDSKTDDGQGAVEKVESMIKEMRKEESDLTKEQAFARILREHPELYAEYVREGGAE